MANRIWLSSPHMSGREMKYIKEAFSYNHVFPLGPNVTGFEEDLKAYTGVRGVSCLSSGTAAIHLALIMLGVKRGDEVICQSFTFSASANPILYQGAIPVFVDSEPATWNLDPATLEEAIKDRIKKGKRPKALILVHLYGMPAMMDEIMAIATKYEIPVIEDAAEALGSSYDGKRCGSFGDIGILSFNGNKIITTSGGGALVSNNLEYCKRATYLATQARDQAPHYQHSEIGYNYRMSNISAGIGRGQMEVLADRIAKRRENYFYYKENVIPDEVERRSGTSSNKGNVGSGNSAISFHSEPNSKFFSNHWLTALTINPEATGGITREDIRLGLEKRSIETRPLWKPMHLQPIFKDYPAFTNGISEDLFNKGLCLPSSSNITDEEREFVVESFLEILNYNL